MAAILRVSNTTRLQYLMSAILHVTSIACNITRQQYSLLAILDLMNSTSKQYKISAKVGIVAYQHCYILETINAINIA